jgi:hypothetical protein
VAQPTANRRPPPPPASAARLTRVEAERLVRDRPLDAGAYTWLGMLDLEAGATEQAIENLRRATFLSRTKPWPSSVSAGRTRASASTRARGPR